MTRTSLLLAVLIVGCVSPRRPDTHDLAAALASEGALAVVAARKASPPAPKPSCVCPGCNGTGYVGDQASIRVVCPRCKGTGKACVSGAKR